MSDRPCEIECRREACGAVATRSQLRENQGRCAACGADSWKIRAITAEKVRVDGRDDAIVTERELVGVDPFTAVHLVEDRAHMGHRFTEVIRRRDLTERGPVGEEPCSLCRTRFVPAATKAWTLQGYCSKACALRAGLAVDVQGGSGEREIARTRDRVIAVTCACGTEFGVSAAWAGCERPCPACGEKVLVPEDAAG